MKYLLLVVILLASPCLAEFEELEPFSPSTSCGASFLLIVPHESISIKAQDPIYPPDGNYTMHLILEQNGKELNSLSYDFEVNRPTPIPITGNQYTIPF